MKGSKRALIALMALSLLLIFAADGIAQMDWYYATIDEVGIASASSIIVRLSDTAAEPTFTRKWFMCKPGAEKVSYATILTALSFDWTIRVYADPSLPSTGERILEKLYLSAQ